MRRLLPAWTGVAVIWLLAGGLILAHLAHAISAGESLLTVFFGILIPLLVSIGVLFGGIWVHWRRVFTPAGTRRVGVWCVIGAMVLSLSAILTILSQHAHSVQMADQGFVVLNAASIGALIGFVVGLYDAQRYQHKRRVQTREQALQELHSTTRALVQTADQQTIATLAVDAARDILDLPISGCWLYEESTDSLRPVAVTDEGDELIEELPTFTADESLSWEAFETGEVMVFDDVRTAAKRYRADTPIRSEIILPLGEYGVMNIGSTETNAFDDLDVSLARILAANTQTAFERADREHQLATARDQATQLNHHLTVLNRVFRHDLRNAANVIHGHAGLLVKDVDTDTTQDSATTIRDQAADLVEMSQQVQDIERLLHDDTDERTIVDLSELIATQLVRIERDYPAVQVDGPTCETCYVSAHPLVESVLRNVIENAVEHNDQATPRVEVSLSQNGDNSVEVKIADNGPGIPEDEVAVLERGYETPLEHTSGLGLWLVNWIVRESGGDAIFRENSPRGSIVCLRFEQATPETRATAAGE